MAKRSVQARVSKPNRSTRIETESSGIPNAREGGVRLKPGESRLQDPSESTWNDLSNEGSPPPDNNQVVDDDEAPEVARTEDEKQDKIRTLLGRQFSGKEVADDAAAVVDGINARTEEVAGGAAATEDEEEETETPAADEPPTRRDLMDRVDAEQRRLTLEKQLGTERRAREQAEAQLKGGLLAVAKAQGLTKDQAIDALLSANDDGAAPVAAAPAPSTDPAVNDRLTRLEQRERDINKREALSVVEEVTKELDIPVTRATSRVTVTDETRRGNDGKALTTVMSGRELVLQTAQRLWERAGKPDGDRRQFITKAAPLVEQQLVDDQKDAFEAYASKVAGKTPAAAGTPPKPRKAPPSLGRNTGGGGAAPAASLKLSDDIDERQQQIKARLGLRGGR